jgi:oxaloacetate decarboxylase (Na+ extruding) subunit gamma
MDEVNLVSEAFKFMALGMTIVFLFLTIMIFLLKFQSFLISKYFSLEEKVTVSKPKNNNINTDEKDTIAAITAAIIHYNNHKRK